MSEELGYYFHSLGDDLPTNGLCFYDAKLSDLTTLLKDNPQLKKLEIKNNCLGEFPAVITQLTELNYLDLSNNALDEIPQAIFELTNLETLILRENNISQIPSTISRLHKLKNLDFFGNRLTALPAELSELRQLESLCLYGNQIEKIPDFIFELPNIRYLNAIENPVTCAPALAKLLARTNPKQDPLQLIQNTRIDFDEFAYINLSNQNLQHVPDELRSLKSIKGIDLSRNQLSQLPSWLMERPELERLVLAHNKFDQIPNGIAHIKGLVYLDLSNNRLTQLDTDFSALLNLRTLNINGNLIGRSGAEFKLPCGSISVNLADNQLQLVPTALSSAELETLDLRNNGFSVFCPTLRGLAVKCALKLRGNPFAGLPETLEDACLFLKTINPADNFDLFSASEIDLSGLNLTSLPAYIGTLRRAQIINLSHNTLTAIPHNIFALPHLTELDLSNNELLALPDQLPGNPKLVQFNLSHNRLEHLPNWLLSCETLTSLNISYNQIACWDFNNMGIHIRRLNLRGNCIAMLYTSQNTLFGLEELDLSHNLIKHLADDFFPMLTGIRRLELDNNQLQQLPSTILNLPHCFINLEENPLVSPPLEVCERSIVAIQKWFAERLAH